MIEWKKNLSPTTASKGTQNDNMYQLLGGARNNNDSEDDSALEENLLKLKDYTYFDGDKILASLKLSAKDRKMAKQSTAQNKVNHLRYLKRLFSSGRTMRTGRCCL